VALLEDFGASLAKLGEADETDSLRFELVFGGRALRDKARVGRVCAGHVDCAGAEGDAPVVVEEGREGEVTKV
jgi:hypothetical protein